MSTSWPSHLPVTAVRTARPTDQLVALVRFYTEALGLPYLGGFEDHNGYDGAFIGTPDGRYHLEFIQNVAGSPGAAPSPDHLFVLYFPDESAVQAVADRLARYGHPAVPAANPYWTKIGAVTVEDPDGWRVVLAVTQQG